MGVPGPSSLLILTFSNSGSTALIGQRIAEQVGMKTEYIDLIPVIKCIDFTQKPVAVTERQPLLDLRNAIGRADVIGLGTFVNAGRPSLGVCELFVDAVLPSDLFSNVMAAFVFATGGGTPSRTMIGNLAQALLTRKPTLPIIGALACRGPENWIPAQALLPTKDAWHAGQIQEAVKFGQRLRQTLAGGELVSCDILPRARVADDVAVRMIKLFVGAAKVDPAKCQRCGVCAEGCPYNAISFDIESGPPRFDSSRCRGCGRCFNVCPARAIEFPRAHSELRSQVRDVKADAPVGSRDTDGLLWVVPTHTQMGRRICAGCGRVGVLLLVVVAGLVLLVAMAR